MKIHKQPFYKELLAGKGLVVAVVAGALGLAGVAYALTPKDMNPPERAVKTEEPYQHAHLADQCSEAAQRLKEQKALTDTTLKQQRAAMDAERQKAKRLINDGLAENKAMLAASISAIEQQYDFGLDDLATYTRKMSVATDTAAAQEKALNASFAETERIAKEAYEEYDATHGKKIEELESHIKTAEKCQTMVKRMKLTLRPAS